MATKSKPFNIENMGPVKQLLNQNSIDLGARNDRVTKLDRASLVFLEDNAEIYPDVRVENAELDAIAKDIAEAGIQQPLIVCPKDDSRFVVISGNRRLAALDLAQKKYGREIEYIPCIVQDPPKDRSELMKRVIKNNLQRTKSSWTRMKEIALYYQAVQAEHEEKGLGGAREVVKQDLGVSDAEITRFMKIYTSLIPGLMDCFREDEEGNSLLATNVAFELAGCSEEEQQLVLKMWDRKSPLTMSRLTAMLEGEPKDPQEAGEADTPKGGGNAETAPSAPEPQNLAEGLQRMLEVCNELISYQIPASSTKGAVRTEQKLMRKLTKELGRVLALRDEVSRYVQKHSARAADEKPAGEDLAAEAPGEES